MNMLGTLLLSLGTPMMLAGDEFGNSQDGNNNAYCQDSPISYLKWDWLYQPEKSWHMHRLETVSKLVALRKSLDLYHQEGFFTRLTQLGLLKPSSRIQWFLPNGTTPMERDWFDLGQRSFAMQLLDASETDILIVINGVPEDRQFRLPADNAWTPAWCSAESTGHMPGHGTTVENLKLEGQQTVWTVSVPESSQIHNLVERMQQGKTDGATARQLSDALDADMAAIARAEARAAAERALHCHAPAPQQSAHAAAAATGVRGEHTQSSQSASYSASMGTSSPNAATPEPQQQSEPQHSSPADTASEQATTGAETDTNVWTFPALSITLMKQLS